MFLPSTSLNCDHHRGTHITLYPTLLNLSPKLILGTSEFLSNDIFEFRCSQIIVTNNSNPSPKYFVALIRHQRYVSRITSSNINLIGILNFDRSEFISNINSITWNNSIRNLLMKKETIDSLI